MRKAATSRNVVFALACISVAFAPTMAFGQSTQQARSSSESSYHLMQLTVKTDQITLEEFADKTGAIRSCLDANNLAEELDAETKKDRFVPSWDLPKDLKDHLSEVPTGHATRIFSDDPSLMRVLVICHRL